MSLLSSWFRIKFGMVGCDVLKKTRNEGSVTEGSAAIAEKPGIAVLRDASFGRTPWHCEHHCSASARPLAASALASPAPAVATTRTIPAVAPILLRMLIALALSLPVEHQRRNSRVGSSEGAGGLLRSGKEGCLPHSTALCHVKSDPAGYVIPAQAVNATEK